MQQQTGFVRRTVLRPVFGALLAVLGFGAREASRRSPKRTSPTGVKLTEDARAIPLARAESTERSHIGILNITDAATALIRSIDTPRVA